MAAAFINRKMAAISIAFVASAAAIPTWTSWQHDQRIKAAFRQVVNQDLASRTIAITTDGVTREGILGKGGAMPVATFGFYNSPSNALLIAESPAGECRSVNLRVTSGQENLPFWQKIFGGAEYERLFVNQAFSSLGYTCAPMASVPSASNAPQP